MTSKSGIWLSQVFGPYVIGSISSIAELISTTHPGNDNLQEPRGVRKGEGEGEGGSHRREHICIFSRNQSTSLHRLTQANALNCEQNVARDNECGRSMFSQRRQIPLNDDERIEIILFAAMERPRQCPHRRPHAYGGGQRIDAQGFLNMMIVKASFAIGDFCRFDTFGGWAGGGWGKKRNIN